jgi:starch synthase (maltosyl-transferring)
LAEGVRIYNLFPLLAGTITEWERQLDRIAGMGFNWIFLNPISYPGFSGSLYAVKDYYELHPLFRGKSKASADKLIRKFLGAAKDRDISVMMDLVVNHTGMDSHLAEQHPEWFHREDDGSLRAPFALDPGDPSKKAVVWADLAEINYEDRPERAEIIDYFADVIRFYVRLGFRGFRCDAAYKVPKDVWRELIQAGRKANDDVLFVAENLGAMMEQVEAMRGGGFDYLFNSAKWWDFRSPWLLEQYEKFRSIAPSIAFPETHDTERLAADLAAEGVTDPTEVERRYCQSYLFSAVFSAGVMIPIGYEYGFKKPLHVVESRPDDWEEPAFDITRFIAEVNKMKASVPALNEEGPQRIAEIDGGQAVCLTRRALRGPSWAVSAINPDRETARTVRLEGIEADLQGGREVTPGGQGAALHPGMEVTLEPGEVRVFARA